MTDGPSSVDLDHRAQRPLAARRRWWARTVTGTALAALVLTGACSSEDPAPSRSSAGTGPEGTAAGAADGPPTDEVGAPVPAPVQTLDIEGGEYVFDYGPGQTDALTAGWTEVHFTNVGQEAHQVMFASIREGVDLEELAAAGAGDSSGASAIGFVDMIGGVSYIDPGNDTRALVDLPEGIVLAMCYVPTPDGEAHALLGMQTLLTVGPAAEAPAPDATSPGDVVGTIAMAADGYQLPDAVDTGWYHVTNTDVREEDPSLGLHEMSMLLLEREVTDDEAAVMVDELAANIVPEVGLDAVGGIGALSAGFDGYLYLDLAPGHYLAVDFMPDPGDPRPHMLDGYWASFDVP